MSWIRSPIARSSGGIFARLSRRSWRPCVRSCSGPRFAEALRSRAVAATAARSASENTLSSLRAAYLVFVAPLVGIWLLLDREVRWFRRPSGGRLLARLALLQDPDRVAE